MLHNRLPPTPPENGCYTLIVFSVGQGIIHSRLAAKAVRRLPDDLACALLVVGAPELGWASILAVLDLTGARPFLWLLERPLCMLISQYGEAFIDRIEAEAARSPVFRECLRHVHPDPVFRIPEPLWERLTHAAGKSIGPMSPRMAALHTEFPDLAETLALDLEPLDPRDAPELGPDDLRAQALGWVEFHDTFWAWVELNRILEQEGPEAAWPIVVALAEQADDDAMPSLGAGALEDLLRRRGAELVGRVETQAGANRRFRFCLSHVWKGEMPDEIWARVVVARGDEPQRG